MGRAVGKLGDRAVVCGAGMGGLLAARVLSDFYSTVTIVERDTLPDDADQRRGVPQGRHFHVLWSRGAHELSELFPGIHDDLIAAGASVCDDGDLSRVSIRVAGHELCREGKFSDPSAVKLHLLSRPLLESQVRQRALAIGNIEILDGHDFVEPIATTPQRVTGAKIVDRETQTQRTLDADLVVDAMGRSGRTPAFLDVLGYPRPVAERSTTNANYTSLLMRIPDGIIKERMTFVVPEPKKATGGAFSVYEHDTWIFTLTRVADNEPPDRPHRDDPDGDAVRAARSTAGAQTRRADQRDLDVPLPRRHLAALRQDGPVPGRLAGVRGCDLQHQPHLWPGHDGGRARGDRAAAVSGRCGRRFRQRFFAAAAAQIGPMWASNQFNDRYMDGGDSEHSPSKELLDFREAVLSAAETSPALSEKLYRSMNLVDPPTDYSPLLASG